MSGPATDRDTPEYALAEAFSARVARWARARHAPDAAADAARDAAYAVSMAVSAGHTCAPLAAIAGGDDGATMRGLLFESRVVGEPGDGGAFPLVVDAAGRLYLARYFDYEARLARAIVERLRMPLAVVPPAATAMLDAQFTRTGATGQKLAAALALLRSFTIVSGGPGTGKTTSVVKLLACLLAADPDCRIALAAPTGKAAARLTEAIAAFRSDVAPALRDRLPADVSTVHRLLGVYADGHGFRHDAAHPLPFDVVVVDEASMLDLALATHLVEAVPRHARVLLIGDKDQLSAVEAGAVFAELSSRRAFTPRCIDALASLTGVASDTIAALTTDAATPLTDAPLTDGVMWLTENFRFAPDSGIGRVATAVNAGDAPAAIAALTDPAATNVRWIDDAGVAPAVETLATITDGYADYVDALRARMPDVERCFGAFGRFRVLCAERRGPRGAEGVNAAMVRLVREALLAGGTEADDDAWFAGRPVMIRTNDYLQNVFNGDVGLALPDATGTLRIWFPAADGTFRAIAPTRLPAHETAFATTVHKAQGSEFDDVLLLLPASATRVVTRELLYTALTRARRGVTIAGSGATLEAAIAAPTARDSGLVDRLRDALTSPSSSPPSPPSSA